MFSAIKMGKIESRCGIPCDTRACGEKNRLRMAMRDFGALRCGNTLRYRLQFSGKKKEPKPKLFGLDIFGWGGGLPREGVGAQKFGMSFQTQENQTLWRDIPGFCWDILGAPKKFVKRKFVFK